MKLTTILMKALDVFLCPELQFTDKTWFQMLSSFMINLAQDEKKKLEESQGDMLKVQVKEKAKKVLQIC